VELLLGVDHPAGPVLGLPQAAAAAAAVVVVLCQLTVVAAGKRQGWLQALNLVLLLLVEWLAGLVLVLVVLLFGCQLELQRRKGDDSREKQASLSVISKTHTQSMHVLGCAQRTLTGNSGAAQHTALYAAAKMLCHSGICPGDG
jgi:hypothetical protein